VRLTWLCFSVFVDVYVLVRVLDSDSTDDDWVGKDWIRDNEWSMDSNGRVDEGMFAEKASCLINERTVCAAQGVVCVVSKE